MKVYQTNEIRNIAIIGGSGSGKTTLTEAMLFEGGVIKRRGSVDSGNTVSDYFPVEKEYGYSVFSTIFSVEWLNKKLNFIDSPGSDDFSGGAVSAMSVTDTALMVVNAQYGIEVGTINLFRYTESLNKPVVFLVNQVDKENADFDKTLMQLKETYGGKVVQIQYPVQSGQHFHQMIDVLKMKMYQWKPEGGTPELLDIPASETSKAEELHNALVEAAAENDEALMEKFFDQGNLTEEEIHKGICKGMLTRGMFPVVCASASKDMGVRRLMEFLGDNVPSVTEMPPYKNTEGKDITPDPAAPTSLFVFKTTVEPHIGRVS